MEFCLLRPFFGEKVPRNSRFRTCGIILTKFRSFCLFHSVLLKDSDHFCKISLNPLVFLIFEILLTFWQYFAHSACTVMILLILDEILLKKFAHFCRNLFAKLVAPKNFRNQVDDTKSYVSLMLA